MSELGQLEQRHEEFARRNTRVIAASLEGPDDAQKTRNQFPHLLVLADQERGLARAADLIHPHAGPDGSDANAPTTVFVDRQGVVRGLYRPGNVTSRLTPDEVLQAVDQHLP
jgi:peroxiredoxin